MQVWPLVVPLLQQRLSLHECVFRHIVICNGEGHLGWKTRMST